MIADEVEELLKDPTPEKARELLDKIPDLVPEDPALAPLLAEEMAKAYGEAFTQTRGSSAPQEEVVNFNPDQPRGQPDNSGQFVSTGGASGSSSDDGDDPSGKDEQTETEEAKKEAEKKNQEFIDNLLAGSPREITPKECDRALGIGFTVNTAGMSKLHFGAQLAEHMSHHSLADQRRRKPLLLYAVKAGKSARQEANPKGGANSYKYEMRFDDFSIRVLTDKSGEVQDVEDVFDIFPDMKKGLKRRRGK